MAQSTPQAKHSEQNILNRVFDEVTGGLDVTQVGFNGTNGVVEPSTIVATKITTVGGATYIAIAPVGTAQSAAGWQCRKLYDDGAGTVTITWADGNGEFDNVATDLTALSYS